MLLKDEVKIMLSKNITFEDWQSLDHIAQELVKFELHLNDYCAEDPELNKIRERLSSAIDNLCLVNILVSEKFGG